MVLSLNRQEPAQQTTTTHTTIAVIVVDCAGYLCLDLCLHAEKRKN